ncbi:MAG TPA: hypothetical protein VGM41_09350 [Chitinophagaceae bacterium]|jgi:hypothetical protein
MRLNLLKKTGTCLAAVVLSLLIITCKKGDNPKEPGKPVVQYGTVLSANGPGNTYELIDSVLGGAAEETPDCSHPAFGRHISEVYDSTLKRYVFAFFIHVTPDNDRCVNFDRQRNEIKTYGPSPNALKAFLNDTVTYHWKFRLDTGFKPSPSFTHIHQIKAGDGDDGAPLITLTPRYGSPDKLQIIHTGSSSATSLGTVASVDLTPFKGAWVQVEEKLTYKTNGSYSITIKRISDGATLLSYSKDGIDLWRDSTSFCRPKWGIYRSLDNSSYLRDEQVRFNDFCIAKNPAVCP